MKRDRQSEIARSKERVIRNKYIVKQRLRGMSLREIAAYHGKCHRTIAKVLIKAGIK